MRILLGHFLLILTGLFHLTSCKPSQDPESDAATERSKKIASIFTVDPIAVEGTNENRLANEPTAFLRSRKNDAIHWQPWSVDLLETAKLEQRLIFAVVASGQHSFCHRFLDSFAASESALTKIYNDSYLCTLVDISAHPEMSLVSQVLATEQNNSLLFPFIIWFTHEGNPTGWTSLRSLQQDESSPTMVRSNEMVTRLWQDSPEYVVKNSKIDNARRIERTKPTISEHLITSEESKKMIHASVGALTSFFDPASGQLDTTGSLVQTDLLHFVAMACEDTNLPSYLRIRSKRMIEQMANQLAEAGISDPLDGGIFASRRSLDWSVPFFIKPTMTQSATATAYAQFYHLTKEPLYLDRSERLLAFVNEVFMTAGDGGVDAFRNLSEESLEKDIYLWSFEELSDLLNTEQLAVAKSAFGISKIGNLDTASLTEDRFFRQNILANKKSPLEVANELSIPIAEAENQISEIIKILARHRDDKASELDAFFVETARITEVNASHALALIRCGSLLNRPDFYAQARDILSYLKDQHYDEIEGLWRIPPQADQRGIQARGRDYAVLIRAALELYRVELKVKDLAWAEALLRESLRKLSNEDFFIREAPVEDNVGEFSTYYPFMLFGRSTWGDLLKSLEHFRRISANAQFQDTAEVIKKVIADKVAHEPVVYTDFLEALIVDSADCVAVLHGPSDSPEFPKLHQILLDPRYEGVVLTRPDAFNAAERHHFDCSTTSLGVTVFKNEKKLGTVSDPEALEELLDTVFSETKAITVPEES